MKISNLTRDSLRATLLILIVTFGVSFVPFKFEFTKGIRQEFLGFDIYDLYYSGKHLSNTQRDTSIILVEIANDRTAIGEQISLIQKYSPALIGVDAVFDNEGDSVDNIKFLNAIRQDSNIVFGSRYFKDPDTDWDTIIGNFFDKEDRHYQSGYMNVLGNQFSVNRNYPPFLHVGDSTYLAFSSAIAKMHWPEKFNQLKKRNKESEIINYTGNLERYTCISKEQLPYFDISGQLKDLLTHKIVLLGYFDKEAPLTMEDLHFSPLNEQVAGKSFPDMYGVVIHANILSMIREGNYASEAPLLVAYAAAGFITLLFMRWILSKYQKGRHPKHMVLLLVQILLILIISYFFLQIFNWFQIKVPLLPLMVALALSVELLDLYGMLALWLHRKYKYTTVFSRKHTT